MSWAKQRTRVLEATQYRCQFCRAHSSRFTRSLDIHHIWPRQFGGTDDYRNLVALCRGCHKQIESWTRNRIERELLEAPRERIQLEIAKRRDPADPGAIGAHMAASYRYHKATAED